MATHSVAANQVAIHELALTISTEEIVQFADDLDRVSVVQISGAEPVYFTTDRTAATVPAAGAASACYATLTALEPVVVDPRSHGASPTQIRLISAAAAVVAVFRG
jgi:hypothetical protein